MNAKFRNDRCFSAIIPLMQKFLYFLFGLVLLAPVSGELWRASIGGLDLLPSDLIIPVIFIVWLVDKLVNDRVVRLGKITKMAGLFLLMGVVSYGLNLFRFDTGEMISAFAALGRLGMYLVLAPIAYDLLERDRDSRFRNFLLIMMFVALALIVILGFLQLRFFPSFYEIGLQFAGWDPHIGRLLSTWFDPNFVGGYLTFMLSITTALSLYFYQVKNKKLFLVLAGLSIISLAALYLTFSRSAYLCMMAALVILSFFKSRRLLVAGILIFVLGFGLSPRMQQRTVDAVISMQSLLGFETQKPLDPTARFRVESWNQAWEIIGDYPVLGAGYNRYSYELNQRGYELMSSHAANGSDSSILTLWSTMGLFGMLTYLGMAFVATVVAVKQIWNKKDFKSYLSAGIIAGLGGLFVHAVFVNSLLFALIMVYFWVSLALLEPVKS